ncbi:MAG: site-specific DNA-methyltransferase [Phycisphaerae bacterium]|nr:site-specific DNA-methyltransferase [Phycisphaerae bacterium]
MPLMSTIENTIIHGDCISILEKQLKQNNGEPFIDLVFADPPFNIGYSYDKYKDNLDYDNYVSWTNDWMTACTAALKDNGSFWIAIGDEYAAEIKITARKLGLTMRNWIIWYYTFGQNTKAKFSRSHTHIFYFAKNDKSLTFNDLEVRVPSARQTTYADKRADGRGKIPDDTWIIRPQAIPDAFLDSEDTWHIPRVCGTFKERKGFHGCQMPEKLLGRIIKVASNPEDLVFDPFSGSGTTVAVAKTLNRRYLATDISENYVQQGLARLESTQNIDLTDTVAYNPPGVQTPIRKRKTKKTKTAPTTSLFDNEE